MHLTKTITSQIAAIVAAMMVYVIHLRTMLQNPATSTAGNVHRYSTLFAGLGGALFIVLMGWITVNDFPWLHLITAILALLLFTTYAASNSVLRIQLAMASSAGDLSERVWALASDAFMVLCIISTFVFLWFWILLDNHCMERHCPEGNSVASSIAEYCIVASIFLYFLPYSWELLVSFIFPACEPCCTAIAVAIPNGMVWPKVPGRGGCCDGRRCRRRRAVC
jgi:hypothetical protein